MDPVNLSLGSDAFRAQMISDVCTDEGIRHEFVLADNPYASVHRQEHYMVIAESDVAAVQQVINDHYPESIGGTQDVAPTTSTPLWQRLVMIGGVVAPIGAVIYALVNDLI